MVQGTDFMFSGKASQLALVVLKLYHDLSLLRVSQVETLAGRTGMSQGTQLGSTLLVLLVLLSHN